MEKVFPKLQLEEYQIIIDIDEEFWKHYCADFDLFHRPIPKVPKSQYLEQLEIMDMNIT